MRKSGGSILVMVIFIAALSGCTKDRYAQSNCQGCPGPIYFKSDVIPVFAANCALSGCHETATSLNHYVALDSAEAYVSITRVGPGYIVAGNPDYSVLLGQLYPGASLHMPNNGGQLSTCDIQKIYCWIQQGAANN